MNQGVVLQRIGRMVRDTRLRRNLSQLQVAEQAGVQRYQVANLELGKGNPSLKTLAAIAGALDFDLTLAARGTTTPRPPSRLKPPIDLEDVLRRCREPLEGPIE